MKPLMLGAGHSWVVGPKQPVRNECEVIYEIFHLVNCGCEIKEALILESNLCNCVYRSLKNSGLQGGFKPVTSRYWCDALTN